MKQPIEKKHNRRAKRAEAIREQRKRALLEVALHVFAERGYHEARISDIVDRAGIARGTFYLYFKSKNAIFHALLDELLARIRENMIGVSLEDGAPPIETQIQQILERVLEVFVSNPALTRIVLHEAVGLDQEVDRKLRDFYSRLHSWLKESLDNGVRIAFLRPTSSDLVAWAVLGAIKQMVQLLVESKGQGPTIAESAQALLDYSFLGLLPRHRGATSPTPD
ncbi:MAG: TetR/AcrR family transcriptional regulator [Deltaproteobacteria bacterium]|nr:TetR/AcrR family transcriptional regulator [Deltaproteobacteria bacterium]